MALGPGFVVQGDALAPAAVRDALSANTALRSPTALGMPLCITVSTIKRSTAEGVEPVGQGNERTSGEGKSALC